MKKGLNLLLKKVEELKLGQYSINISREYLQNNEYELRFDTIAEYLYEDKIKIEESTYDLMMMLTARMKLSKDKYLYLNELKNKDE